jgi:hypothetical protein
LGQGLLVKPGVFPPAEINCALSIFGVEIVNFPGDLLTPEPVPRGNEIIEFADRSITGNDTGKGLKF